MNIENVKMYDGIEAMMGYHFFDTRCEINGKTVFLFFLSDQSNWRLSSINHYADVRFTSEDFREIEQTVLKRPTIRLRLVLHKLGLPFYKRKQGITH